MRAIAPGKVLLTGAYAVLEGAPAIVVAIDRHAVADASPAELDPAGEVTALSGDEPTPRADVRALHDATGRKLGLGSSAAAIVASIGARALARGEDLRSSLVRTRIFQAAREAHARAQQGGSGVDVAASVHGGLLRYCVEANGHATIRAVALPNGIHLTVYDSGTSMRTSDMRARFDALRSRPQSRRVLTTLCDLATQSAAAVDSGDARAFVRCAREFGAALAVLGREADAPIVVPSVAELASLAATEDAAFLPSGAGGGDVAVRLAMGPPSMAFASRANALFLSPIALGIDHEGLRPELAS